MALKPHLTDEIIRIINNEASVCKQHVIIVAAGDGASLKCIIYSSRYTDER